jgi:hypothetical protein
MLATLTNGIFAVPENPVMRAARGMGMLQAGNGSAFGQSVDMTPGSGFVPGPPGPIGGGSSGYVAPSFGSTNGNGGNFSPGSGAASASAPVQTMNQNGQLVWVGGNPDGSIYTAQYCDSIITGGTASDVDKFQCSVRGFVGAAATPSAAVQPLPPALVPAPPTSVTIPTAVATVNAPRPVPRRPMTRCQQQQQHVQDDGTTQNFLLIGFALVVGYCLTAR